ncbi:hypothetical protein Tco_0583458 [Tanacetum coccineum]
MFKYRDTENEAVCLMMFPFRFFPPALFDRLLGEIRAFSQHENESLTDAWLRMKEMLRNCHGHNLSKGQYYSYILYIGLNEITLEVLNVIAGGIFLYKTPNQAYQLLEDKVLLKLDWAKNQKTKSSLKKTVTFADEGNSNSDTYKIMAQIDAMTIKMDTQYKELQSRAKQPTPNLNDDDIPMSREEEVKFRLADKQSGRPSGSLPSNTQPNQRDNPNDQQNNSETPINFDSDDEDDEPTPQPETKPLKPVKEMTLPKLYKPKIPYPQRLRKEKMEAQYEKFLDMIRAVRINVPLVDVLAGIPNYGKFLKELINNKHKIEQISAAFLSDESSAILQNKVPPKLGDPRNEGSKILHSIEGTLLGEEIFSEFDKFIAMNADENYDSESDTEERPFEKITINTDYKIKTSLEEPPTDLELKPLPNNLEYVFLEEPSFLPLLDDKKQVVQKQRRLNPNMQEVVKKEIMVKGECAFLNFKPGSTFCKILCFTFHRDYEFEGEISSCSDFFSSSEPPQPAAK